MKFESNLEPEFNPYASPHVSERLSDEQDSQTESTDCPPLPLVLRPTVSEMVFVTIFGSLLALASVFALRASVSLYSFPLTTPLSIASALIATASFAGSIIFLSSTRARVIADETQLQSRAIKGRSIQYQEIESWHLHPATGAVQLTIAGQSNHVTVPSWPISKRDSDSLGAVLRTYVGPPGTNG